MCNVCTSPVYSGNMLFAYILELLRCFLQSMETYIGYIILKHIDRPAHLGSSEYKKV